MGRNLRDWIVAARPWSLSASFIAAVAPIAYCYYSYSDLQNVELSVIAIFMMLIFQMAGNLLGDYADNLSGVDSRSDYNGVMSMKSGKFKPSEIRNYGYAMLSVGILLGLFIVLYTRLWWLLVFGVAGTILTVFYYWLKYHSLSDVVILLLYSMVPALGMTYLLTGTWDFRTLYICLPYGLMIVAILHANNTRDITTDRAAGIKTVSSHIGGATAQMLYVVEVTVPYILMIIYTIIGKLPYISLITFITLPVAIKLSTIMLKAPVESDVAIATLDQKQGKLTLMFGLLLTISLLFSCSTVGNKYDISITSPVKSDSIYLGRYFMGKVQFVDSLKLVDGVGHFKGNKPLKQGIYLLAFSDGNYVDMLVGENQTIKVELDTLNMPYNVKFQKNSETAMFYDFSMEFFKMRNRYRELGAEAYADTSAANRVRIEAEITEMAEKQKAIVDDILRNYPDAMLGLFVKGMQTPEPEEFKAPEGCANPDSLQAAYYYTFFRDHFFDNIDLGDERVYYTPYISSKLSYYLDRVLVQRYDSIVPQAVKMLEASAANDSAYNIMASYLTGYVNRYDIPGFYNENKMMGLDNLIVELADRYYSTERVPESDSVITKRVLKRAEMIRGCMIGNVAKDIPLADIDGNYTNLYDHCGTDYTILVFYEPECDHCKTRLPKVAEFYNFFENDSHVNAVAFCMTEDKRLLENFIKEGYTENLTNVWDPNRKCEYYKYYDTSESPMIMVLDSERKIIARNIEPEELYRWIRF